MTLFLKNRMMTTIKPILKTGHEDFHSSGSTLLDGLVALTGRGFVTEGNEMRMGSTLLRIAIKGEI
jgi:hypothetical protein